MASKEALFIVENLIGAIARETMKVKRIEIKDTPPTIQYYAIRSLKPETSGAIMKKFADLLVSATASEQMKHQGIYISKTNSWTGIGEELKLQARPYAMRTAKNRIPTKTVFVFNWSEWEDETPINCDVVGAINDGVTIQTNCNVVGAINDGVTIQTKTIDEKAKLNPECKAFFLFYVVRNINEISKKLIKWKKPKRSTIYQQVPSRYGQEGFPTWIRQFNHSFGNFFGLLHTSSQYQRAFKNLGKVHGIVIMKNESRKKFETVASYGRFGPLCVKFEDVVSELFDEFLAAVKYAHKKLSYHVNPLFLKLADVQTCIKEYPLLSAAEDRLNKAIEEKRRIDEFSQNFFSGFAFNEIDDEIDGNHDY